MRCRLVWITPDAERLMGYCARVSNPANQDNPNVAGLLRYCIKNAHWSVFEMADLCIEVQTTRSISAQIIRHRSMHFQEFCVTGDARITGLLPSKSKDRPQYYPIAKLFERQNWKQYRAIWLRVYDQENGRFTRARLREVFYTGKKDVYELTLADGKRIKCSKEHRFLTRDGFVALEDIVGLRMVGDRAVMTKIGYVGTNGVPCHRDRAWLQSQREAKPRKSLAAIATEAGVTIHTIRKWLRVHGLQFTQKEVAEYRSIWNKGTFGYHTSLKHSPQHLAAIRAARSGPKSNWWKGGVDRGERQRIWDWCQKIRLRKLREANYLCATCSQPGRLELDHVLPVYARPDLAYSEANIQVLCSKCHDKKHSLDGDPKIWRARGRGNTLIPRWTQVEKIVFLGPQDTYDLEIDHESHNYVANKIVVHNSLRYAELQKIERVRPRRQDPKNRQSSHDDLPADTLEWFDRAQDEHFDEAYRLYEEALAKGIAKESARFLLPLASATTIYMKGSVRDWIHYINLRTDASTQLEHREIAEECRRIFVEQLPVVAEALGWEIPVAHA